MATGADVVLRFKADVSGLDVSGVTNEIEKATKGAREEADNLTEAFKKTKKATKGLNKDFKNLLGDFSGGKGSVEDQAEAHSKLQEAMQGLSSATNIFLGLGLYRTFGAATSTMQDAISAHTEFNKTVAEMNSLISGSVATMGRFREELLRISQEVPKSPAELGAGAYQVLSAGILDAAKSTEVMKVAAKTASAGLADTQDTAQALVSILNAYDLEAKDATRVSDLLFKTVKRGIVRMEDLNTAMSNILPVAAGFNIRMEELFAAIQTMTKAGVPASKATRFLRQAIQNVVQPSEEAKKVFEELGIEWGASALEARGLFGTMKNISEAMGLLKPDVRAVIKEFIDGQRTFEQAKMALEEMGGATQNITRIFTSRRGLMAAMNLTGSQLNNFQENLKATQDAEGAMGAAFDRATDTIEAQARIAKNNLMTAFAGAEGVLRDLVDIGVDFSKWLADNRDLVEDTSKAVATLVAQVTALFIFKKVTDAIESTVATLKATVIVMKQLNAESFKAISRFAGLASGATAALSTFQAFNDGSDSMARNLRRISSAMAGVAAAAEVFKASMTVTGNPLLSALLGLGAGGAAGVLNLKGLEKMQGAFEDTTTAAEEFEQAMEGTVSDVEQAIKEKIAKAAEDSVDRFVDEMDRAVAAFKKALQEIQQEPVEGVKLGLQFQELDKTLERRIRERAEIIETGQGLRGVPGPDVLSTSRRGDNLAKDINIAVGKGIAKAFDAAFTGEGPRTTADITAQAREEVVNQMGEQQIVLNRVIDGMEDFRKKIDDSGRSMDELVDVTRQRMKAQGASEEQIRSFTKSTLELEVAASSVAKSLKPEDFEATRNRLLSLMKEFRNATGTLEGFTNFLKVQKTEGGDFAFFMRDFGTPRIPKAGPKGLPEVTPFFAEERTFGGGEAAVSVENLKSAADAITAVSDQMDFLSTETQNVVKEFQKFQRVLQAREFLDTINQLKGVDINTGEVLKTVLGQTFDEFKDDLAQSIDQGQVVELLQRIINPVEATQEAQEETAKATKELQKSLVDQLIGEDLAAFANKVVNITSDFDNLSKQTQQLVNDMEKLQQLIGALQFIQLIRDIKFPGGGGGGGGGADGGGQAGGGAISITPEAVTEAVRNVNEGILQVTNPQKTAEFLEENIAKGLSGEELVEEATGINFVGAAVQRIVQGGQLNRLVSGSGGGDISPTEPFRGNLIGGRTQEAVPFDRFLEIVRKVGPNIGKERLRSALGKLNEAFVTGQPASEVLISIQDILQGNLEEATGLLPAAAAGGGGGGGGGVTGGARAAASAFADVNIQELIAAAFQESGMGDNLDAFLGNITTGSLKEIISLFFKQGQVNKNVKTLGDKAGDIVGAMGAFQQPLQIAKEQWSSVNQDLASIGVTLSDVEAALEGVAEIQVLDQMLSLLQSIRTIQQNVGVQRISNLGQAIEGTQMRILEEGRKFVTSLATDDPAKLAEVLARQQRIEQNIDQSQDFNIILRVNVAPGGDTPAAAQLAEDAATELQRELRERGSGVRR